MGTHPNVPSKVDNELLATILKNDPEFYLGNKIMTRYPSSASDGSLPFLFKILSIKKALSIQAHPDKQLAERLNKERPEVYKGELQSRRRGKRLGETFGDGDDKCR